MKPTSYFYVPKLALLLVLLAMITGCGSGGTVTGASGETGAISARLVWPEATAAVATKASAPAGVVTIRLIVSGPGMTTIQRDFPASAGGGVIDGIPVGTGRTLTIQGLDASGTVIYQSVVYGITIGAGQTSNLGTVVMQPVTPPEPDPPPVVTYSVTPAAGAGGSISPATAQTVIQGTSTSFTITPDTGYSINTVSGCGGTLVGNTYTTGAITGNCAVSATFSQLSYTVTPSAGAGGSISPATAQSVGYGGNTSFTVTPNAGYAINTVSGCGGVLVGSTYTTGTITGNCTVTASFSILTYTVTPSAGAGGSISPATAQSVSHGNSTSFTVTPDSGYAINTVSGCGGSLAGNTYTTGAITGNCSVSATFTGVSGTATFTW